MADTNARMLQLIGSDADWLANDLVLFAGEIGFSLQDGIIRGKVGDGNKLFSELPYTIGVQEIITPSDFGCIGDGVADDTVNFLAAHNYCQINNVALHFPAEFTYRLTQPIPLYNGMCYLGTRGSERDSTQRSVILNNDTDMFSMGGSGTTVDDITLQGVTLRGASGNNCFQDNSNGNLGLRYAEISFCGFDGFSRIYDNFLTGCFIHHNWFDCLGEMDPGFTSPLIFRGADFRFHHNYIDWQETSSGDQIVTDFRSCSKCVISDNFWTGHNATPVKFTGNRAGSGSRGVIFVNNHIDTTATGQIDGAGVWLEQVEGAMVYANRFQRCLGAPSGIFNAALILNDCINIWTGTNEFYNMLTSAVSHGLVKIRDSGAYTVDNMLVEPQMQYDGVAELQELLITGTVGLRTRQFYERLQINDRIEYLDDNFAAPKNQFRVTGDATPRFITRTDGRMQWSDGTNATDTNLYRDDVETLRTDGAFRVGNYTVATVPSAAASGAGSLIFVTDESGGPTTAESDGANWKRLYDRQVIS